MAAQPRPPILRHRWGGALAVEQQSCGKRAWVRTAARRPKVRPTVAAEWSRPHRQRRTAQASVSEAGPAMECVTETAELIKEAERNREAMIAQ